MKLKNKHFEIAETISYFVDRNPYTGFPDFVEPTREQVNLFTEIETYGKKRKLSEEEYTLVKPMLNGKENYDLTLKMFHEELREWVTNGWGWYGPVTSIIEEAEKEPKLNSYVKAIKKIKEKIEDTSALEVLAHYTGF